MHVCIEFVNIGSIVGILYDMYMDIALDYSAAMDKNR